uniref:Vascular permeability factor n=2 Tax=Monodelphis domestica TaxID=13616 RepID=A0A5F8GL10_MONDO
ALLLAQSPRDPAAPELTLLSHHHQPPSQPTDKRGDPPRTHTFSSPRASDSGELGCRRPGAEPRSAARNGVEEPEVREYALKLFGQLLSCSRLGGAVIRTGSAKPCRAEGNTQSGPDQQQQQQRRQQLRQRQEEEEEEKEENEEEVRGLRERQKLGSREPCSWTGEALESTVSTQPASAPQALARALAPGKKGDSEEGAGGTRPPTPPPPKSKRGRRSESLTGSDRASETMNFMLTWVHWCLALLLYLHHAKWSQAAPTPEEGERKSPEVVKFMDVYQRSYCRAIETLVDIFQEYPDEVEFIFKPSCVPLMRCAGCCNDEGLECVPSEVHNVTMQIMRIKPHQSQHIGEMSFLEHSKCECRPKKDVKGKQENPCGPCSERRKHLFVQDPQTCKCSCKNTDSRCKARQLELNERTCRCDKPRR